MGNNSKAVTPAPKMMNSVERRELRKLIDADFALMQQKLRQQEAELRVAIEERIIAEHADVVKAANAKLDALKAEMEAEEKRFEKLREEHNERNKAIEDKFAKLRVEEAKNGIAPGGTTSWYGGRRFLSGAEPFEAADVSERVNKELQKLKLEKGDAMIALQERKNAIDRQIILGAIQSDEGLRFLESIPTANELLPSVEDVNALVIEAVPVEVDED
jgi:hypothetical protein